MERYRPSQIFVLVAQLYREPLVAEIFRMHANDQYFLVVGTIEYADPAAFGKPARRAPEKIMFQFFGAGLFETEHLAACGLTPDMTCRMAPSLPAASMP